MTYRNSPIFFAASLSLGALAEVGKHFDLFDTLAERRKAAEGVDVVLAGQLNASREALKIAQADDDKVQGKLKSSTRVLDDAKLRAANEIDVQIDKTQTELNGLQAQIATRTAELRNVSSSFGGLKKRLNLAEQM